MGSFDDDYAMDEEFIQNWRNEDYNKDLNLLLHSFSAFSHDEIVSVLTGADRDVEIAADVLLQRSKDREGSSKTEKSQSKLVNAAVTDEPDFFHESCSQDDCDGLLSRDFPSLEETMRQSRKPQKSKKSSVSIGLVSNFLGKEYSRPGSNSAESRKDWKSKKISTDELEKQKVDVEVFVVSMLGNQCQLSLDVIRDVLEEYGYDIEKSVEKLLCLSTEVFGNDNYDNLATINKFTDKKLKSIPTGDEEVATRIQTNGENGTTAKENPSETSQPKKTKKDLELEVLSWFTAPERSEPTVNRIQLRKSPRKQRVRSVVTPVPTEIPEETKENDKDDGHHAAKMDQYNLLRISAQQHWDTVKSYFQSAAEAYSNGKLDDAISLSEQGKPYYEKALEVHEKIGKLLSSSETENKEFILNLRNYGSNRDALEILKFHISSLSGIPDIQYLKILTETKGQSDLNGSKQNFITKYLERKQVQWNEEGDSSVIVIPLQNIDGRKFSNTDDKD